MRKLQVAEFLTLDGVMEAPDQWNSPFLNEEMGMDIGSSLFKIDALLYGRRTYEEMAAAWPGRSSAAHPQRFDPHRKPADDAFRQPETRTICSPYSVADGRFGLPAPCTPRTRARPRPWSERRRLGYGVVKTTSTQ